MLTTINGSPAQPLGLAAYPGQSQRCVKTAFDAGVNFFFFYGPSHTSVIHGLRRARPGVFTPWEDLGSAFGADGSHVFMVKMNYWLGL